MITFDPSLNSGTIALASSITIAQNQILQGPRRRALPIGGGAATQMLVISSGTVAISGLTFTGGNISGSTGNGGAISNAGTLTVTSSAFTSNTAGQFGGAIYNAGTLTVTGSTFTSNTATSSGGALFNLSGALTVTGSTFTSNTATNNGGGAIDNGGSALTVAGSTFTSNSAPGSLGGAIASFGPATMTNSTFSGNSSANGAALCTGGPGTTTLVSVTVAASTGSAALSVQSGTFQLRNSIVAGNSTDIDTATITSLGYNVIGTTPGAGYTTATGDQLGVGAMLAVLANNGGPTLTMLPASASPAANAIPVASCVDASVQPALRSTSAACVRGRR